MSYMSRPWDELLKVKLLTLWSAVLGWLPFGLLETPRARGDVDLAEQFEKINAKWYSSLILFSVFNSTVFFGFYF